MATNRESKFSKILASKKLLILLAMGFASGLPFPLTHGTLQAWFTDAEISTIAIGYILTIISYPYALKFLWAPLFDRFLPPLLGLRRGWMFISQLFLAILLIVIGFINPQIDLKLFVTVALLLSIVSATQDIIIDAYRVEILDEKERGLAMSSAVLGYRVALIIGNSLALYLADYYSWQFVYLLMAFFMLLGAAVTLISEEPAIHRDKNISFAQSFVLPLRDFFGRSYAFEILAFVLLYKFGEILALSLTTNFMMQIGFSKTEIGVVTKGVGLFATILGTMAGGLLMIKISLKQSLWFFGFAQSIAIAGYLILAEIGRSSLVMASCIIAENFSLGLASSAFMAFLMSLCNTKFTATQYALLTSLIAFAHSNAPALAGELVAHFGWEMFFIICIASTLPGLLLLLRLDKWLEKPLS